MQFGSRENFLNKNFSLGSSVAAKACVCSGRRREHYQTRNFPPANSPFSPENVPPKAHSGKTQTFHKLLLLTLFISRQPTDEGMSGIAHFLSFHPFRKYANSAIFGSCLLVVE
jgi:hypothetical protein